jgi:hypothetical protein
VNLGESHFEVIVDKSQVNSESCLHGDQVWRRLFALYQTGHLLCLLIQLHDLKVILSNLRDRKSPIFKSMLKMGVALTICNSRGVLIILSQSAGFEIL